MGLGLSEGSNPSFSVPLTQSIPSLLNLKRERDLFFDDFPLVQELGRRSLVDAIDSILAYFGRVLDIAPISPNP